MSALFKKSVCVASIMEHLKTITGIEAENRFQIYVLHCVQRFCPSVIAHLATCDTHLSSQ